MSKEKNAAGELGLDERFDRIVELEAQKALIDAELKEHKAALVVSLTPGTHETDTHKVTIKKGAKRLNSSLFEKEFPADKEENKAAYKLAVDTTVAKKMAADRPDLFTESSPSVRVERIQLETPEDSDTLF